MELILLIGPENQDFTWKKSKHSTFKSRLSVVVLFGPPQGGAGEWLELDKAFPHSGKK